MGVLETPRWDVEPPRQATTASYELLIESVAKRPGKWALIAEDLSLRETRNIMRAFNAAGLTCRKVPVGNPKPGAPPTYNVFASQHAKTHPCTVCGEMLSTAPQQRGAHYRMHNQEKDRAQDVHGEALKLPCPACWASPGQRCKNGRTHEKRLSAARRAIQQRMG
jgi:predicted RNA-binding Zn-ribbon protein involved in translation (DUF1610 family)